MIKKLKNKMKSSKGNAVIVLGLILIMAALFAGGMLLDVTKAYQMKSAYTDAARKATQTAIRHQDSEGNLKVEAVAEAYKFYETVAVPSIINEDGYMSSCNKKRSVLLVAYFMDENFERGEHTAIISSKNITKNTSIDNVLFWTRINGRRGVSPIIQQEIKDAGYKGIELEVTESTPNVILPGAMTISGLDRDNLKCQKIGIKEGASQLIGDESDRYN